jgi:hypothetical protein
LDTLIFLLILATFLAMVTGRRGISLLFFVASLAAVLLLFNHHATSRLPLNF